MRDIDIALASLAGDNQIYFSPRLTHEGKRTAEMARALETRMGAAESAASVAAAAPT